MAKHVDSHENNDKNRENNEYAEKNPVDKWPIVGIAMQSFLHHEHSGIHYVFVQITRDTAIVNS